MTSPAEAAQLLTLAAAHDPRLNTADADQAKARVLAWAQTLADVPAEFAAEYVARAYRTERTWPLQAGEVRDAYKAAERAEEARSRPRTALTGVPPPESFYEAREALRRSNAEREGRAYVPREE